MTRAALTRRGLVVTGLPLAALATASTKVIAASRQPDAKLLRLGEALSSAWAQEIAAANDDDAKLDAAIQATSDIVAKIEMLPATTLAGLIVKARACHWCHCGDPIDETFFGETTTDMRLVTGILGDLIAMGVANA